MKETQVRSLVWEDSLEKGMATNSRILAWRVPWTEEPGGLQSMGSQRVRHNWACSHALQIFQSFHSDGFFVTHKLLSNENETNQVQENKTLHWKKKKTIKVQHNKVLLEKILSTPIPMSLTYFLQAIVHFGPSLQWQPCLYFLCIHLVLLSTFQKILHHRLHPSS